MAGISTTLKKLHWLPVASNQAILGGIVIAAATRCLIGGCQYPSPTTRRELLYLSPALMKLMVSAYDYWVNVYKNGFSSVGYLLGYPPRRPHYIREYPQGGCWS